MALALFIQTTIPLFSLILLGYLSRFYRVLNQGDDRVFSSYIYYIGLPALLIIDLSELKFTGDTLSYVIINLIPLFIILPIIYFVGLILRTDREMLLLLIILASFGSLGFFGLAFINFAFNNLEFERYAALSISSINTFGFIISLILLELFGSKSKEGLFKKITFNLASNPLIISIIVGILLSITNFNLPSPISSSLHMIASTVSPLSIFLLGVSIYGKEYNNLLEATLMSSIRLIILPFIALLVSNYFNLPSIQKSVIVIMYGTPLALSMIILSQKYKFQEQRISSIILISSLLAGITMNIWLLIIYSL